jgi:hypothetical protein
MNTKRTELPLCPFCGSMAWLYTRAGVLNGAIGHRVECEGECHAMTCYWHTKEEAIEHWSMRKAKEVKK